MNAPSPGPPIAAWRSIAPSQETFHRRLARGWPRLRKPRASSTGQGRLRTQRRSDLNFIIGLIIAVGSILGGYAALGGHLTVLMQPFEFVIIAGSSLGIFVVANPLITIKDCGKAIGEAIF